MSRHKFFLPLCCLGLFALILPAGPAPAQVQNFGEQRQKADPPPTPPETRPAPGLSGERPDGHNRRRGPAARPWRNQAKPLTQNALRYGMKPTDPLQYGIIPNRVISPGETSGPDRHPPRRPEHGVNFSLGRYSDYGRDYYYDDGYYNSSTFYSDDSPDRNIFDPPPAPASYFETGGTFERFEPEYDPLRPEEGGGPENTAPRSGQSSSGPRSSDRAGQAGQSDLDWYEKMSQAWR
jgi:hypothetical protein